MVKIKDAQFFVKNLKMKRKKDNIFLTLRSGDSNLRFSVIFLPMIRIFMKGEGDEIKPKLRSYDFSTLAKNSKTEEALTMTMRWLASYPLMDMPCIYNKLSYLPRPSHDNSPN